MLFLRRCFQTRAGRRWTEYEPVDLETLESKALLQTQHIRPLGHRRDGQKGANKMERKIKLEAKDFSNFLRCLSTLKDVFKDADIRGGVLRQRSTDKASIFEMDLSPLISDCDICIDNLKGKLTLLKGLSKQAVQITITDNEIYFSSQRSIFSFDKPNPSFLGNKFMTKEELANIFTLNEQDLVLEYPVKKDLCNLMKVTARQFDIVSFQISFEGDTASITASTVDKKQHSEMEYGIPIKKTLKCFSNIVVTPFLIDHDRDILFKMYDIQNTLCINKFAALIGKIAVDVYCRSQLIEEYSVKEEEGE